MSATDAVREAVTATGARSDVAARVAAAIRAEAGYRWVGVYDVGSEQIAALGWTGAEAPAFPTFPRDRGLCGAAAASGATVVANDVAADPRYLTTFGSTRAEIVVPVVVGDEVRGLIDVESERLNAFGEADRRLLEECALAAAPLWEES